MPAHKIEPTPKTCKACGRTFLTGGRGRPKRTQELCSDVCQRAARFRRGSKSKPLDGYDAAYIAGLIDGEGSVMAPKRWAVISIRLTCSNTKRSVLDWLAEVTGVGNVCANRPEGEYNAASFVWNTNGEAAESVLQQIRPYMRIKTEQADHALWIMEQLRIPARKADRSWYDEARTRMAELNRRGPR
jgi:hypothetical protein